MICQSNSDCVAARRRKILFTAVNKITSIKTAAEVTWFVRHEVVSLAIHCEDSINIAISRQAVCNQWKQVEAASDPDGSDN